MPVKFDKAKCDQNPYCPVTRLCPTGAMYIDRKTFRPAFDDSKCTDCELCVTSCPREAISPG